MTTRRDEIEGFVDGTNILPFGSRRQFRLTLAASIAVFCMTLGYMLFVMPQKYVTETSISVQESAGSVTPFGLASMMANPTRKYIGILRSHRLASSVAEELNIREALHLKREKDAIALVQQAVMPQDNDKDGLLDIDVALRGPALKRRVPETDRTKLMHLAADIANAYARELQHYYKTFDNDTGHVLLRQADEQVALARGEFDVATAKLKTYVRKMPPNSEIAVEIGGASGTTQNGAQLNMELRDVEAEIAQLNVQDARTRELQLQVLNDPNSLPTEDPTLAAARENLARAKRELNTTSTLFKPTHPKYVTAAAAVKLAQEELDRQLARFKAGKTTQIAQQKGVLAGLETKRAAIKNQIDVYEHHSVERRQNSLEMSLLRTEMDNRLELLKTALADREKLRLTEASAASRFVVVDPATPPESGSPSIVSMLIYSTLAAATVIGISLASMLYMRMPRYEDEDGTLPALPGGPLRREIEAAVAPRQVEASSPPELNGHENGHGKEAEPTDAPASLPSGDQQ